MAKIEREFLERANPRTGDFKAREFMPRVKSADIGLERIGGERFYTQEFMQAEWDHVWTKTWQVATRVSDLAEPGSYFVHEIGKEQLLFVKGDDHVIRGFYNVCQHRGNRLVQSERGEIDVFTCPFHGWQWNNDGSLRTVSDPQFFRQFDDGVPTEELGLQTVKVDAWGGWLWFNLDPDSCSLKDYLGEPGEHLETYQFEDWSLIDYQTFEWDGNWKHAVDAFNESYHFASLHPDMIQFGEGHDVPIELLGIHSRMINFNRTVSEVVEDQDTITPLREHMAVRGLGENVTSFQGSAKDIHLEAIRLRREVEDDSYLPYKDMNDEQLVHQYHYTFFPNSTFTQTPEGGVLFRYRPHATDPNKCYYDFLIMAHLPPGTPQPEVPPHRVHKHSDGGDYGPSFVGTFDPILANVLSEDGSNMVTMQNGVKSDSFKGMILCDQEVRLRHFHQTIDRFISGDVSTRNLPASDAYYEK
jgi:phenylpropionate dioxygenase-like ring-hydroxylating dioxygenase large terminal subunit